MKGVYYNEIEPYAADWLENLIREGLIPQGEVDRRSIVDVHASDLRGFVSAHFFAGIGGWPHALRLAGWPDDRPIWTGSCPCQPFSAAGKQGGFADDRHLWPFFFKLIAECQPDVVVGEQVASKDGLQWLDLVLTDLEGAGYAAGAVDLCAAGVGAPHIRQRLWWVGHRLADAGRAASERDAGGVPAAEAERAGAWREDGRHDLGHRDGGAALELADASEGGRSLLGETRLHGGGQCRDDHAGRGEDGGLVDSLGTRLEGHDEHGGGAPGWALEARPAPASGGAGGLEDAHGAVSEQPSGAGRGSSEAPGRWPNAEPDRRGELVEEQPAAGPVNGEWRAADWLFCRDGKWRPIEPGTFPLAHGVPARVGRLRAYGNAIVPQVAALVIEALKEVIDVDPRN
jgi:DNA (cytosine-5)-methyltransferase 1